VFELTENPAFRYKGDLVNQLRRASLSISNNIAEGFERGTTNELITFLYIARGSAGEVRSMLRFALRLTALAACRSELAAVVGEAEAVSRQLRAWLDSLQNSDIEGQRRLNDQTRRSYENRHSVTEFERQQAEFKARMEEGLRNGTWGRAVPASPPDPPT
jgi:four helix bundle protein